MSGTQKERIQSLQTITLPSVISFFICRIHKLLLALSRPAGCLARVPQMEFGAPNPAAENVTYRSLRSMYFKMTMFLMRRLRVGFNLLLTLLNALSKITQ